MGHVKSCKCYQSCAASGFVSVQMLPDQNQRKKPYRMKTSRQFIRALHQLHFDNTFNPYVDRCPIHDYHDAPKKRTRVLTHILNAALQSNIDAIWIGRDLGYRGGRRTGLPLTDDVHTDQHLKRWGVAPVRTTKGTAVAERTAAVIWSILDRIDKSIFLWNVFPLHPHEPNNALSNRAHNAAERQAGEELLASLITMLQPRRLIAIGNDAAQSANRLTNQHEVIKVRHPSYGGQTRFLQQMRTLYNLPADKI